MADNNTSNVRPDLDESINVSDAHAALKEDGAAVAREKRLRENGLEPIALWLILVCGLVVLVGGSVLGKGGNLLAYNELVKDGYLREKAPGKQEAVIIPLPVIDLLRKDGAKVYSKCAACHQTNGQGTATVPPLAGSEWVTGSSQMLSQIILNGLKGPITVAGKSYGTESMPTMAAGLGKKELAALMTYIRTEWGNDASLVTPEMADEALKIYKARTPGQIDVNELKSAHDKMLPGAVLAPETLFDPETFEPVEQDAAK